VSNLCDNQIRFTKIEKLYKQLVGVQVKKILKEKNGEYTISIGAIAHFLGTSLFYELLHPFGFSAGQIEEATRLMQARTGAQLVANTGNWRLVKHRNWLILSPQQSKHTDFIEVSSAQASIEFSNGTLAFQEIKKIDSKDWSSASVALLNRKLLAFPLQVRRWRAGDYFYPLGMAKKKKLARFLIDLKFSLPDKEKVWVLTAGDKIVWVIGIRIDERFKVTPPCNDALRIEYRSLPQS
jgi:tRNA(Ile)-lysidine synthase